MSDQVGRAVRAVMIGLHIVIAMVPAACQPSPGELCGDGYCSASTRCMMVSLNGEATKPTCIVPGHCGNGVLEPDEQCDDGNKEDGDSCEHDCTLPTCNNGIVDPGEECDTKDVNGFHCSEKCKLKVCGNGRVDPGEECDGTAGPQPCSMSCHLEICGNGVLDNDQVNGISEQCDDGNTKDGDGCSGGCKYEFCGDGHTNFHEQCDPTDPRYGPVQCNSNCTLSSCGDGLINPFADPPEQCDLGTVNGVKLNQDQAPCTLMCQINVCGDGKLLLGVEECDDGAANGTAGSGCDLFCKNNLCGNGIVDVGAGEECDPGGGPNPIDTATCTSTCHIPRCGDHEVDGLFKPDGMHGEMCDDGETNGDACPYNHPDCMRCNSTCTAMINPSGPFCGDGIKQTDHEQCDPATGPAAILSNAPLLANGDSANCDFDCTLPTCGDGHLNTLAGETCDDGNRSACGTCRSTTDTDCHGARLITPTPATSTITTTAGEQINRGDTDDFIELNDGFGNVLTFEFTTGSTTNANAIPIHFSKTADGAATIATKMAATIHGQAQQGFGIDARVPVPPGDPTTVVLTNKRKSSRGNTTITFTGLSGFMFSDIDDAGTPKMARGAAGDCAAAVGCASGDDCTSNFCNSSQQCQACTLDSECGSPNHCNVAIGRCE